MEQRPLQIASGRQPFQVAIMVASVFLGLALTITDRVPNSAAKTMHPAVLNAWVGMLLLAGTLALVGVFWSGAFRTALRLETAGVLMLAGGSSMYAVAVFSVSGWAALIAGGYTTAIAFGCWWRAYQLVRDVRKLAHAGVARLPVLVEEEIP
ncbi:hypothetical protein ACQP2Y_21465 [Actinoplanes sp. CA-051413]|uniref:hypothetical protein n=1 Tax=Actinoplanes sp. CA-051413 TaxID=3239899 RepID=UPI003D99120E